ncbi:MAG: hypothetical protein ABSF29_08490 [Tepidisphaeraceae bacterium]
MTTATSAGAGVTIFQPQLEDFQGDQIKAHAAIAVVMPGQQQPTYGAVWLQSQVSTDRVARTVQIIQVTVTRTLFPSLDQPTSQSIADAVTQALMANPPTLSLDQLLAMLQAVQKEQQQSADLKFDPPRIIFFQHPAVKVQYDGAPRLIEVPNSNLLRAVNTPFFVVLDPTAKLYYLKGAGRWFTAPDAMGPFQLVGGAPPNIVDLAQQSGYTDPQQPISDADADELQMETRSRTCSSISIRSRRSCCSPGDGIPRPIKMAPGRIFRRKTCRRILRGYQRAVQRRTCCRSYRARSRRRTRSRIRLSRKRPPSTRRIISNLRWITTGIPISSRSAARPSFMRTIVPVP